jgi:hypothetical protein
MSPSGENRDLAGRTAAHLDLQRLQPGREDRETSPLAVDGWGTSGRRPNIGDIGYYAPSGDLVFYYGDVGYWSGIVRIGRFDTSVELIEHDEDKFQVTIELA